MIPPDKPREKTGSRRRAAVRASLEAGGERDGTSMPDFLTRPGPATAAMMLVLMVVVGGLLLGRSKLSVTGTGESKRIARAARNIKTLKIALENFRRDVGRYPSAEEGLKALIVNPGLEDWRGRYVTRMVPDPWGTPYGYAVAGGEAEVYSAGPDAVSGTGDDVRVSEDIRLPGRAPSP
ncbi:MAG: type II secretion system protein GspG [Kiritimatiellia bacterium]